MMESETIFIHPHVLALMWMISLVFFLHIQWLSEHSFPISLWGGGIFRKVFQLTSIMVTSLINFPSLYSLATLSINFSS